MCLGNATLAGCRWPRIFLPQDAEIESISPSSRVKLQAVVAAVINHDDLVGVRGEILPAKRIEASDYRTRTVPCGDDHAG